MRIDVVSIFPSYLEPLQLSLVGRAIETGLVDLRVHDLRDRTHDRHRTVDDTPYGGGAGMVMRPEPWGEALDALAADADREPVLVLPTPSGRLLTQDLAQDLAGEDWLIIGCGRYEGIDARVPAYAAGRMRVLEVSIGDYVLNGGEAAALVLIEAIVRLLPGVIGNPASLTEESHATGQDGLLEYPSYTKPPSWRGLDVPAVLFSGHHAKIAAWRREQSLALTRDRRPELLRQMVLIDAVRPADAGELWTLQRAAYLSEGVLNGSLDIPPLTESLDELEVSLPGPDDPSVAVLAARLDGRLIGSVRGERRPDGVWYVGRLMVAPDAQRHGIGSALLSAIEDRAPSDTTTYAMVTGSASMLNLGFYRRRGYVEVGRHEAPGAEVIELVKPAGTPSPSRN